MRPMRNSRQFSDVGVAGLCCAGRSLALRLAAMGLRVSLWCGSAAGVERFIRCQAGTRGGLVGYSDCEDFVESLDEPRTIVVFETELFGTKQSPAATLRELLSEMDRLVEYPLREQDVLSDDLDLLELTLLFQMA